MSKIEYRALSRSLIPDWEGGDGKAMGDWWLHGCYPTRKEARDALSGARGRGWQTRIVQASPTMVGTERIVETTGLRPGDADAAEDYDAPA